MEKEWFRYFPTQIATVGQWERNQEAICFCAAARLRLGSTRRDGLGGLKLRTWFAKPWSSFLHNASLDVTVWVILRLQGTFWCFWLLEALPATQVRQPCWTEAGQKFRSVAKNPPKQCWKRHVRMRDVALASDVPQQLICSPTDLGSRGPLSPEKFHD